MQNVEGFLNKKMDRREFLILVGLMCMTVFGIKNLLSSISELTQLKPKQSWGFGSGPYGGSKGGMNG